MVRHITPLLDRDFDVVSGGGNSPLRCGRCRFRVGGWCERHDFAADDGGYCVEFDKLELVA
ncbi:hypothetical protein BEN30_00785 [Magnetovibrio blakemorei]|uniref:Uncharacterized protein n=2 Tax=Magnetovibrio blakemorei TaxID=28181 RepID=A0A1E5Q497_9PROT|nr:hypothetical protein BEN30_00785 [Magnetovibrio blakemorei]